jgi:predicted enzyme related to lactoylglutathione lyase
MTDAASAPASQTAAPPSARFGFMKFVVRDLEPMKAFYEQAFGLVVAQRIDLPDAVELILRRPGEETGFSLILYWNKVGREVTVGTGHGPLGLFVRDVDAAYAHAVSRGAAPHRGPWDTEAMRVAFVLDPEGRELELISMRR